MTDLEKAKAQLRAIQDRWDAAGKVPARRHGAGREGDAPHRADGARRRGRASGSRATPRWPRAPAPWSTSSSAPLRTCEDDLAKAEASGNASKVRKAREALEARQVWLDQARAGVAEFGG